MSQTDKLKLDVRVRDRLLSRGILGAEELETHLAGLTDCETGSEAINVQQPALGNADGASVPTPGMVGAEAASDEDLVAP